MAKAKSDTDRRLGDENFTARLIATGDKIETQDLPDENNPKDKSWKEIDIVISKVYKWLEDEGDDDPPEILFVKLMDIYGADRDEHGMSTLEGIRHIAIRACHTRRLIREYQQLKDEDAKATIDDPYRLSFFSQFTNETKVWLLLKVIGGELLSRGVKRMVRDE